MKADDRYVFDTNVIVSALLFKDSTPARAFFAALDREKILLSLPPLRELSEVLSRKKFDRYVLREERERFLMALVREASLVEATEKITGCRDARDNKFLELAMDGRATCIITGDEHLLELNPFRGIPIMTPEAFRTALGVLPQ